MTKTMAVATIAGLMAMPAMGGTFARVNVPFAFFVGDKELPAGSYEIESVSANAMRITNLEDNDKVVAFNPIGILRNGTADYRTKLVFTRYGTDYYLSEIWKPGARTGSAIIKSDHELASAKRRNLRALKRSPRHDRRSLRRSILLANRCR